MNLLEWMTLILIALKVFGIVHVPWWVVFLPAALSVLLGLILGLAAAFRR